MGSRSLLAILSTRPFGGFFFGVIMLKKCILALALMAGLSSAHAAGTINYSLSQQFDQYGKVLAGCKLYIIQAGTVSTPQIAYQDSALTIPSPGGSQLTCDAAGRLPQFFLADGSIKIRLTDKNGVSQVTADGILVIGPSAGGGGGGGTVDPTTIMATGDIKSRYGTGVLTGFVRLNGRTIGSATSGATERANADAQALFEYLWAADTTLAVSTGRGASANADWVANKTIALPDARGRTLAGANDMGNSNATILNPLATTKGDTITLGSLMGWGASRALSASNMAPYTAAGTITNGIIRPQQFFGGTASGTLSYQAGGTIAPGVPLNSEIWGPLGTPGVAHAFPQDASSFAGNSNGGSSAAFDTITPLMIITIYQKL